jgi:hypothetical protein
MEKKAALLGTNEERQCKQEGALACPVRTDDGHRLVRCDGEALNPQYFAPASDHTKVPDLQHGLRGRK